MASESENSPRSGSPRSILERLINSRNRDLSLLIPFILGFSMPVTDPDGFRVESPESTTDPEDTSGNRSNPDDDSSENHRSSSDETNRRARMILLNSVIDPSGFRAESGGTGSDPDENPGNRVNPDETNQRERIILINPLTQSMMVMEGIGLDSILRGIQGKGEQPPASKSSVEALPRVEIKDGDEMGGECVICLEEFNVGNIIKKMPCQHGFHEKCIEKWLSIHGSCPICRHKMPVEDDERQNTNDNDNDNNNGRVSREFWVRVSFGGGRGRGSGIGDDTHDSGLNDQTVVNESDHMEN